MNNKRPNIQGLNQSVPREPIFDSDPLFESLEGSDKDFGRDLLSLFKSIDAFRDAKDDRAIENIIKQRVSGKVFILENMGQSEFYNRNKAPSRTIPSRDCLGQHSRASKGLDDLSKLTYGDAERLNSLWITYASAFLEVVNRMAASPQLAETGDPFEFAHDFVNHHFELTGATIEVVHSQNSQLMGMAGIVVRENENSFEIVSSSNKRRLIPKDVTTIRVHISRHPGLILRGPELAGIGRSGSVFRASKKVQNRTKKNSLSYS